MHIVGLALLTVLLLEVCALPVAAAPYNGGNGTPASDEAPAPPERGEEVPRHPVEWRNDVTPPSIRSVVFRMKEVDEQGDVGWKDMKTAPNFHDIWKFGSNKRNMDIIDGRIVCVVTDDRFFDTGTTRIWVWIDGREGAGHDMRHVSGSTYQLDFRLNKASDAGKTRKFVIKAQDAAGNIAYHGSGGQTEGQPVPHSVVVQSVRKPGSGGIGFGDSTPKEAEGDGIKEDSDEDWVGAREKKLGTKWYAGLGVEYINDKKYYWVSVKIENNRVTRKRHSPQKSHSECYNSYLVRIMDTRKRAPYADRAFFYWRGEGKTKGQLNIVRVGWSALDDTSNIWGWERAAGGDYGGHHGFEGHGTGRPYEDSGHYTYARTA